jgi:hypothetical protein
MTDDEVNFESHSCSFSLSQVLSYFLDINRSGRPKQNRPFGRIITIAAVPSTNHKKNNK